MTIPHTFGKPGVSSALHSRLCSMRRHELFKRGNGMTAEEYKIMSDTDFTDVGLEKPAGISGAQDSSPVFRFRLGGSKITILFGDKESKDVKERIRDILTESYEERIQRQIQESVKP